MGRVDKNTACPFLDLNRQKPLKNNLIVIYQLQHLSHAKRDHQIVKMAITSAISDLFKSFYELLASVFGTAYSIVYSAFAAVFSFINGIFTLAGDILGGFIDITTGVGKFVVGTYHHHPQW